MNPPRPIFSIDSATSSGVALLVPGSVSGGVCLYRLALHGTLRPTSDEGARRAAVSAQRAAAAPSLATYIEEPYLARGAQANPRTLASLVTNRTHWQSAAESRGWQVTLVRAQQWQSQFLGAPRGAPRKTRKVLAVRRVLGVLGLQVTQDEADAICMAIWALRLESTAAGVWCRLDESPATADRVRWI